MINSSRMFPCLARLAPDVVDTSRADFAVSSLSAKSATVSLGPVAVLEYIPKAAVQAAGIGGIADLAIRRKQPLASGNF